MFSVATGQFDEVDSYTKMLVKAIKAKAQLYRTDTHCITQIVTPHDSQPLEYVTEYDSGELASCFPIVLDSVACIAIPGLHILKSDEDFPHEMGAGMIPAQTSPSVGL